MSATNSTPIINLPLFIGTDKPAWLTDWNGAMNTIDSSIAALQTAEAGTATSLASLAQSVKALSGTVEQHTTAIQTVTTATATNTGSINTITSLIGNGLPTTDDKTIIGAINELKSDVDELAPSGDLEAENVVYDNTASGLTATNVQAAIDELAAGNTDKTGLLAGVSLASNTSFATAFTCPADGYVFLAKSSSTRSTIAIYGSDAADNASPHFALSSVTPDVNISEYVKKGMKIFASLASGDQASYFQFN